MKKQTRKRTHSKPYNPSLGFIGKSEVKVANYLFTKQRNNRPHPYARPMANQIDPGQVEDLFKDSRKLTKFLRSRDLTFSKKTQSGQKTFTVPCTTTIVPMPKSLFNQIESAAQVLVFSLRKVIQDIYGSKDLKSSKFIQSLPADIRKTFIEAIETSACYYPQLHHPNMKSYPFFDNIGLDLVLIEDYIKKSSNFPKLIQKRPSKLPELPFRILEINAGSPSGASNNMNILQGLYQLNPEVMNEMGKLLPNDHFEVLSQTYKSLGENWTNIENGIQIILPPGGRNGAAPEIHQLAAYSGLVYADPDQLFCDSKGYIRLRTVGKRNPIVTAIYSRVNADFALYNPKRKLFLRDPDNGQPLYAKDQLRMNSNGEAPDLVDQRGRRVPLTSTYSIPGAIDAILNKKLYLGGLNRILDNKIILATLTHYAPKYFEKDIKKAGLTSKGPKILPPKTLEPKKESVEIIKSNPDNWVVKAPSLAGGEGVYILKTLSQSDKKRVLRKITETPDKFAYQELVKIGRIPVAVQNKSDQTYRFANLAADLRMWVFYGAGSKVVPQVTHNALVRYAPQEKGKKSSIVNTSSGGGYAPFVIVDDIGDKQSVPAKRLVEDKPVLPLACELPVFVGAQFVQVSQMLRSISRELEKESPSLFEIYKNHDCLKSQLKEVISFINPRAIEYIYKNIDFLLTKISRKRIEVFTKKLTDRKLDLSLELSHLKNEAKKIQLFDQLQSLYILDAPYSHGIYPKEQKLSDLRLINSLSLESKEADDSALLSNIGEILKELVTLEIPNETLSQSGKTLLRENLQIFCQLAAERLVQSKSSREFASLFSLKADVKPLQFQTLYLDHKLDSKPIMNATQWELVHNKSLLNSGHVKENLKLARNAWLEAKSKAGFDESRAREKHFKDFPFLKTYQRLVNSNDLEKSELTKIMDIAPYAHFNIQAFTKNLGIKRSDLFSDRLKKDRLSLLNETSLKRHKLYYSDYAGECFAKKKKAHGLFSQSDQYIWLRKDLDPFTLVYTAGHELVHYQQIQENMEYEKEAVKKGSVSTAKFLNFYGNFLGANSRSIEKLDSNYQDDRKPLYGHIPLIEKHYAHPLLKRLRSEIEKGDQAWVAALERYGNFIGLATPVETVNKVKALQEVLPALENAKNILFAQELGLEINMDPVSACLPTATVAEREYYRSLILAQARSTSVDWEAMRVIASYQYYGVTFFRKKNSKSSVMIKPMNSMISVGASYNQTQQ